MALSNLFQNIYGQDAAVERLTQSIDRLQSSLLFSGPSGVGKKTMALRTAQALFGETSPRPVEEMCNHSSVLLIEPEGLSIKMESVARIRDFLKLQSFSKARVVVIEAAHKMNFQTQNALLKLLEEPPANVYFILITESPDRLLPTVRSRTRGLHFHSLGLSDLKKIFPEEEEWKLAACRGSADRIHQWEDEEELHRDIFYFWPHLLERKKISKTFATRLKERKTAVLTARTWQEILRDVRMQNKEVFLNHKLVYGRLSEQPHGFIDWCYKEALALESDVLSYLDPLLCFENFQSKAMRLLT